MCQILDTNQQKKLKIQHKCKKLHKKKQNFFFLCKFQDKKKTSRAHVDFDIFNFLGLNVTLKNTPKN